MNSAILFLSRSHNSYIENLNGVIDHSYSIYDDEIPDKPILDLNFNNLTVTHKMPTALEKAFYFLFINNDIYDKYNFFYLIEDDVYFQNPEILKDLISKIDSLYKDIDLISFDIHTKQFNNKWCWWNKIKNYGSLNNLCRSFNPMCRLSKRLIDKIYEFKNKNHSLLFHEILYASLCIDNNFATIDLRQSELYKQYFGFFDWQRKNRQINNSYICHPVKINYEK